MPIKQKTKPQDPDEQAFEGLPAPAPMTELTSHFEQIDQARQAQIDAHPLTHFLEVHASLGTPDTQAVCGIRDSVRSVVVTLGEIKQIHELAR